MQGSTPMTMTAQQQFAARKMFGATAQSGTQNQVSGYMEQEVLQWSPEKIILKTYDLFIISCKKKDIPKMNRILASLMSSLNFDYPDPATRLYRLYEYAQRCIAESKFDRALHIIQELRDSWAQAFNLK